MPKSRNRRRKKKPKSLKVTTKEERLHFTGFVPKDLDREKLRLALIAKSKESEEKLPSKRQELIESIQSVDPLMLLTNMAWVSTTNFRSPGNITDWTPPHQSQIEFAQAVALTGGDKPGLKIPSAHFIQSCLDNLKEYYDLIQSSRFSQLENTREEDQKRIVLRERIRLHTELVRNWGYIHHVKEILSDVYIPLNAQIQEQCGLTAEQLIGLFVHLMDKMESTVNQHFMKFRRALRKSTKREILVQYYEEFGIEKDKLEDHWHLVKDHKMSKEQHISLLLQHSMLFLVNNYIFDIGELAEQLEVNEADLGKAIGTLGYEFGDLSADDVYKFHLSNPVWTKPLIRLEGGKFFCPIPMIFFGQSFQLIDEFLKVKFEKPLNKAKSSALENKIEQLFKQTFDDAEIEKNVEWYFEGTRYETDLLVKIDRLLFIVEAKSGRISQPALRGADKRVQRHIKELLLEPAIQSARLETQINTGITGIETDLDFTQVDEIHRISVSLEDFAMLHSNPRLLTEDEQKILPFTSTIADLMVVFEILEPWQVLHYLTRRESVQKRVDFIGDEIDLIGLYLHTGFFLAEAEMQNYTIVANGLSDRIDNFYSGDVDKPRREFGAWFEQLIGQILERKFSGWAQLLNYLLDLDVDQQKTVERWFFKVQRKLKNKSADITNFDYALTLIPHGNQRCAYAFAAFRPMDYDNRHKICEDAVSFAFEDSDHEMCAMIALNTEHSRKSYSLAGLYSRGEDIN